MIASEEFSTFPPLANGGNSVRHSFFLGARIRKKIQKIIKEDLRIFGILRILC